MNPAKFATLALGIVGALLTAIPLLLASYFLPDFAFAEWDSIPTWWLIVAAWFGGCFSAGAFGSLFDREEEGETVTTTHTSGEGSTTIIVPLINVEEAETLIELLTSEINDCDAGEMDRENYLIKIVRKLEGHLSENTKRREEGAGDE